ncbi:MAG: aldolase/citrate lyase family protein [Steroidobacteraceae bacterium]|nr:aldolase/citrate lyase family protein [Steroidobacteraceae bacterium]
MTATDPAATFRARLRERQRLVGTFVKTPAPVVCEVLAGSGLDLLTLDAEHAPFGRAELDGCLAICRALGMPTLVRVPAAEPAQLLNALDCGASGVLVPHVRTAAEAEAAVRACHYGAGGRGYSGSTRAAGFAGRTIAEQLARGREGSAVILQVEDAEAVDEAGRIAAVPGVDALFIGRVDLTVSLGCTRTDAPLVVEAVERICAAAARVGTAVGMFVADPAEARQWTAHGASLFILGSDQGFLLSGARALVEAVR